MKVVFPIDLAYLDFLKNESFLFSEKVFTSAFAFANIFVRDLESRGSFGEHFDVPLSSRYNALRTIVFFMYDLLRLSH